MTKLRIDSAELLERYPIGEKLGSGQQGSVYQSEGAAVKVFDFAENPAYLYAAFSELDFYLSLDHPNIIKPLAWAVDVKKRKFYIALPLGETVIHPDMDYSPERFSADLMSAVAFLHQNGICHRDIKHDNLIFSEGKIKLIDFGVAIHLGRFRNEQGVPDYYTKDVALAYDDPYHYVHIYNSIKVELYSVARTIDEYRCQDQFDGEDPNTTLEEFIDEIDRPLKERKSAVEFLQHPAIKEFVTLGGVRTKASIPPIDPICMKITAEICNGVLRYASLLNVNAHITFLAAHLIKRALPVLYPDYVNKSAILLDRKVIYPCVALAYIIANQGGGSKTLLPIETEVFEDTLNEIIAVHDILNGVIWSETLWDQASSAGELPDLLNYTLSCDYDPSKICYPMPNNVSKDLLIDKILDNVRQQQLFLGETPPMKYLKSINPLMPPPLPQFIYSKDDFEKALTILIKSEPGRFVTTVLSILLTFPEFLAGLPNDLAMKAYKHSSAHFDSEKYLERISVLGKIELKETWSINPFSISKSEAQALLEESQNPISNMEE